MPTDEQNLAELNQNRKQEKESSDQQTAAPEQTSPASFPWGMFFVALLFDIVGLIPILNLFTEFLASLIIWFWQKHYEPKLDPLLSLLVNKIIDFFSLGLYPSNIGMVLVAYIKKKAQSKAESPIIKTVTGKLASSEA